MEKDMAEKKVDWDKANPDVEYVGTRITLPGNPGKMPLSAAFADEHAPQESTP